jgi:hypothetical protein
MLQRTCFAVFLLCAAGLAPLYGGKPGGGCQDIPIQWTVNDYYVDGTTLNAIRADRSSPYTDAPYTNGQSGVSALIKTCDVNGTNNAVLMTGSSRQLTFDFAAHLLASTITTPSWAYGIVTGSGGVLNIRNITFRRDTEIATEYSFTTWMGSNVPVKGTWNFRMWYPTTDAVVGDPTNPNVIAANSPNPDTLVNAYHCPANNPSPSLMCTGVVLETWFVWPVGSSPWVGGLVTTQTSTPVNGGQFSMPFYFVISVL